MPDAHELADAVAVDDAGRLVTYGAARGATIADRDLGVRRRLAGPDGPTPDSAFDGGGSPFE